jgi:NADPH-dependent 2,4-dienoyl-CoA reductase/sulfur reductase-like enzyme
MFTTGVVRDSKFFWNAKKILTLVNTEVIKIDPKRQSDRIQEITYRKTASVTLRQLIIATGATPRKPPVPGIDLKGVTTLQSLSDADFMRKVQSMRVKSKKRL